MKSLLRQLPAVHELQRDSRFTNLMRNHQIDHVQLTEILKEIIDQIRIEILNKNWNGAEPGTALFLDELFTRLSEEVGSKLTFTLKTVINATGTILHTNLGRARLSEQAVNHVIQTARNYSNLEYNLHEGKRGSRHSHVEEIIKEITGAEAAMVVNNNAAAVYLILKALAEDREVIVSRGQLVEIGGSFRISSIMKESGARLVEVGTTNKTHLHDYESALNEHTAMILKVHTSNYKIMGFTKTVETEEIAHLTSQYENVIFYEDLGSGALYDFSRHKIGEEPVVSDVLKMGADLVSFSGDKLLGGPQAGIIAGKKELIERLKKHQLARVVRVDKMTLAALEGTLIDYARGENGLKNIPTIRDLLVPIDEIKRRTENLAIQLKTHTNQYSIKVREGFSQVGGGTMPDVLLPTFILTITHQNLSAEQISKKLRSEFLPAIVVRIQKEEIQIDLRTVSEEEEALLFNALKNLDG